MGRPVAIRDEEIEIDFPEEAGPEHGYPPPFPALMRTIQLYGKVTDLLNSIRDLHTVAPKTLQRLLAMEANLTKVYHGLSPKLQLNLPNFRHYADINQSTIFMLLHVWFHSLIVLLYQPTLLAAVNPASHELSMSSAKAMADILVFEKLVDSKALNRNPFTSQPIYIDACAFLEEIAAHSSSNPTSHQKPTTKHALLTQAAHQNHQLCYETLKLMETHWGGAKKRPPLGGVAAGISFEVSLQERSRAAAGCLVRIR